MIAACLKDRAGGLEVESRSSRVGGTGPSVKYLVFIIVRAHDGKSTGRYERSDLNKGHY